MLKSPPPPREVHPSTYCKEGEKETENNDISIPALIWKLSVVLEAKGEIY